MLTLWPAPWPPLACPLATYGLPPWPPSPLAPLLAGGGNCGVAPERPASLSLRGDGGEAVNKGWPERLATPLAPAHLRLYGPREFGAGTPATHEKGET